MQNVLLAVSTKEGDLYLVEAESLEKFYKHTRESVLVFLGDRVVNRSKIDDITQANWLHQYIYTKSLLVRKELLQKYLQTVKEGRYRDITKQMIDRWELNYMSKLQDNV